MHARRDERELTVAVDAIEDVADDVRMLTLRAVEGSLPPWTPGSHIDLHLGEALVRQYSLCSDPMESSAWRVIVLREEDSTGGSALVHTRMRAGDVLTARGPRNLFELVNSPAYVFVAGGVGIAPLLPMIQSAARAGADWILLYGGRRRSRMAFLGDLQTRFGARVVAFPEDETGPVDLSALANAGPDTAIYCCGPEGLIGAVEAAHARTGRGTLHIERFRPKDLAPPIAGRFEVEARRSGTIVTVHPDESVLDALEGAGVRIISSCREGICGTCEVFVVEGEPEHRDSILTPEERKAGETMFVCVSRCLSQRLVLDI